MSLHCCFFACVFVDHCIDRSSLFRQVYIVPVSVPSQPQSRLIRQLVDYERVHLTPGETATLTFSVSSASFRIVDKASGDVMSAPGSFTLLFTNGVSLNVTSSVLITGTPVVAVPFPY